MAQTKAKPIDSLLEPFLRFARLEASGGILLLAATVAALVWANSPWEASYHALWHTPASVGYGKYVLAQDLHHWINDGLMCIFFFLVGLEIKREILSGELSTLKRAAFPFAAALGGVLVPALIYFVLNRQSEALHGWAIPMATDIAFALGVLALLGDRVPVALKIFVTALAIVDDIVGVLVIAVFYTSEISLRSLVAGLAGIGISYLANRIGVRRPFVYALIGVFVWLATLKSGVHATIAGIVLAFTIPTETHIDTPEFLRRSRDILGGIENVADDQNGVAHQQEGAAYQLECQSQMLQSPLFRIEHSLQPWVSFLIMPLFALANAGVHVLGNVGAALASSVSLGVMLGLIVGKPIGITLLAWLAAKSGLASKPLDVRWSQLFGGACLCGIGFTMSLFIATLAFGSSPLLDLSKIGTLAASLAAGIVGSIILARSSSGSPARP